MYIACQMAQKGWYTMDAIFHQMFVFDSIGYPKWLHQSTIGENKKVGETWNLTVFKLNNTYVKSETLSYEGRTSRIPDQHKKLLLEYHTWNILA
jgi:hypothetical protein